MTEYSDEVDERYCAIMTGYDERCAAIFAARLHEHDADALQRHLDLTAETWDALVAAGITQRDADRLLGVFAL
jgi:hypothetical protein